MNPDHRLSNENTHIAEERRTAHIRSGSQIMGTIDISLVAGAGHDDFPSSLVDPGEN